MFYPKLGLSLGDEEAIRQGRKTDSMLAERIKNGSVSMNEGHNNDTEFPVRNIRGKVLGFSAANGAASWNSTVYVNVHCTLEKSPQEEATLTLRLEHAQRLELNQYDTFLISFSDRDADTR